MMVELEEAKQLNGSLKLVEEEYEDTHQRSKMVHQDASSLVIIPKEEAEGCSTCIIQKKIFEGETTTTTAVTTMTSCLQFSITSISSENCISQPPVGLGLTQSDNQNITKKSNKKDKKDNINFNETQSPSQSHKSPKLHQMNQALKVIEKKVKTPRIYSFYYRRKKLGMKPTGQMNLSTVNEAILFGNISIQGNYENDEEHSPVTSASRILSVFSSVKDLNTNCLELKFTTTHWNQHINFKFLVDHFKKMPSSSQSPSSPQRLSRALAEYQKLLQNRILPHIGSTNRMMSDSPDSIEEITSTLDAAENQLRKRLSALGTEFSFYKYVIQKVNFTTKQLDTTSIGLSFGLLELLQVPENDTDYYIRENLQQLIQFESIPNGEQRMENTASTLEALTKQLRSTSASQIFIKTMRNTYIPVIASTEYFYPNDILQEVPSWMHYTDILGYAVKYTLIKNEIGGQNRLNSRVNLENTNIITNQNCNITNKDFELGRILDNVTDDKLKYGYQQSMEFLGKYYPNSPRIAPDGYPLISNQIKKKTLE